MTNGAVAVNAVGAATSDALQAVITSTDVAAMADEEASYQQMNHAAELTGPSKRVKLSWWT